MTVRRDDVRAEQPRTPRLYEYVRSVISWNPRIILNPSVLWVITRCGDLKPTFRDYLSVPSSRVKLSSSWTAWTLKMGTIGSPKTSVSNNVRSVITHKTEEFSSTAAKTYELAQIALFFLYGSTTCLSHYRTNQKTLLRRTVKWTTMKERVRIWTVSVSQDMHCIKMFQDINCIKVSQDMNCTKVSHDMNCIKVSQDMGQQWPPSRTAMNFNVP